MRVGQHTVRGHELLERGDVDGAMNAFLDALAEDPNDVPAMLSRLEILALHRENHVGAVAAGRVLRKRGIGGVAMASAFSYSLQALAKHAEALEVIYEGLRTAPETETLWYNAACSHMKLGQTAGVAIAIEVATELLPANGPLARADEDFSSVAAEDWFVRATEPRGRSSRPATPLRVLLAGETSLAPALESMGHTVERRTFEPTTGDSCAALCAGLLAGDHDRVFVVDDGSDAARWTERELALQRRMSGESPPVALLAPTWISTEHLPSFHAPGDVWGPGALGMLRFFLGPLASQPPE